jgi:hypothetical protein
MKYTVLIIVVGLLILLYFRKQKKAKKKVKTVKARPGRPVGPVFCPYCKFEFNEKPKRNSKCPSCQKKIVLRNSKLLTEVQAADYDRNKYAKIGQQIAASQKKSLIEYKKSGVVKYVEIISAGETSCQACKRLNGKRFRLKDELHNPTLPVKNCTGGYGYCRCCYVPVVK